MMEWTYVDVAGMIDHSLLAPTLTAADLDEGCRTAARYRVASACIMPFHLKRCVELLEGSGVLPSTTVGFPHGSHHTATKVREAEQALADGGRELDMVVNISKVLSEDWDYVRQDIAEVLAAVKRAGAKLKVIFENCYLQDTHKIRLCRIASELGVHWVKTSTGFGSGGAVDADLVLMRAHSSPAVQVKAAGGVRTLDRLLEVRALGVSRVGATRTVEILDEAKRRLGAV